MEEQEKKNFGKSVYISLAIVSFFFFFFVSFPWGILKEAIVAQVRGVSPIGVQISELGPSFPVGFQADGIKLTSADGSKQAELKHIEINVSILSLLIGNLGLSVEAEDMQGGELSLDTGLSISKLMSGQAIPNDVDLNSKNFSLGPLVSLGLNVYSDHANELIKGLIKQIDLRGKLNGIAKLSINSSTPTQSKGEVKLNIKDMILAINDPNLDIAPQKFKKAIVSAKMKSGSFSVNKVSGFHSGELVVDLSGILKFSKPINRSNLNFNIDLKLMGGLQENFGFLLSMGGGSDSNAKYRITGTLGRPDFQTN